MMTAGFRGSRPTRLPFGLMGNQISVGAAQSALLTSRRAVDLCRVGSCLCRLR